VNSGADKSFFLPIGGTGDDFSADYDWDVDWGDGITENKTGYGSAGSALKHTYPNANTNYIISITPHNASSAGDGAGWFYAFGFSGNYLEENASKLLYVDGILDDKAINVSKSGACWSMFEGCVNLNMGPNFRFEIKSTEAKMLFATDMFKGCANLVLNDVFVLPMISQDSLKDRVYSGTFAGVTAKQNRTALEIIGSTMNGYGSAAPAEALGTFSAAFDTTGVTNPNWYK
jgi:hypothetical protein